ncbi:MAG: hypothetical protein JWQ43_325 [Glaciihabitans sp.]|nr:hypothetical protein [Glaciihabitans sp.]
MTQRQPHRRRPFGRRRSPVADVTLVASVVQRLAVLLAAGVPPVAAWGYLQGEGVAGRIASAVATGVKVPEAIIAALVPSPDPGGTPTVPAAVPAAEAIAWRGLATAWAVALDAGAPLAPTLRDFATSLRSLAQAQREIHIALAAPAATAKMVMALPAVGILFGMALGFNTIRTLTSTPLGIGSLVIGLLLLVAAARWNKHLVTAAQPRDLTPGLEYDLTAIAVSGGGALRRARTSVAEAMLGYGLKEHPVVPPPTAARGRAFDWRRPDRAGDTNSSRGGTTHTGGVDKADEDSAAKGVESVLELSRRAGVPAAELLRSEAEELRRGARAEVAERAASLSVKLMLPLGLCVLPAFMVVGVFPLLISVITSTDIGY